MADDYSINAKITADASGYESGIKKAQKATKNLSKSVSGIVQGLGKSGFVGALGAVGLATNGVTAVLGVAKKAFQQISKTVNEYTEAYKKQYKAEIALETVAKNNPFIDGTNVRALKNFASEIQAISNYGDEELLPLMANLTALGRTESETMQIMKVATDMASTGMVSLETAVNQLNMTLNGNIGRLGVQNAELKNLTEEELKSGKAVEILGKKYEGLAKTTSDTSKQMKNAIGDFKELLGETFENALAPMRKYFTEIITKTNNAIKKAREHKKAVADVFDEDGGVKTDTAQTDNLQQSLIELQKEYEKAYRDQQQYLRLYGQYIDQTTDATALAYARDIKALEDKIKFITDELLKRKQESEQAKKQAEIQKTQAEKEKEIADLKDKYLKKIAEQEARWKNTELITKEAVSNEEKLKFYQEQLVAIITEAGGQISTNNQYYKDQMVIINDLINKIAEEPTPSSEWVNKLKEQKIEMLKEERDRAIENAKSEGKETYSIRRYYNEQILELALENLEREKQEALENEELKEGDKLAIIEYYKNKEKEIYEELGDYKKDKNEEEVENTKITYSAIIQMAKKYAESIKNIFSKIASTIKDVFSKVSSFIKNVFDKTKNIFTKLFDFNVDDALNALLKIEDAILTFFVETLPRLPSFFESAVSSISILINTLNNTLDWDKIKGFLDSIVNTFVTNGPEIVSGIVEIFSNLVTTISTVLVENAPQIVDALGEMFFTIIEALPSLIENFMKVVGTFLSEIGRYITENGERLAEDLSAIVESIVQGISNFITSGGWKNLLDALLTIQRALEKAVMDNIDELVDTIIAGLPDLINMLIESIVSASKTLAKLIKPILKLIIALIKALIEVAFSDEVLDASIEVVQSLIESLLDMFINEFPKILPKMITKITGFITKSLPKMTNAIIKSLVKVLLNTNWGEVFYEVIVGIGESFGEIGEMLKDIFEDAFNTIGEVFNTIWEGIFANPWLWHVLNGVGENISNFFNSLGEGMTWVVNQIKSSFEWAFNGIKSFFDSIFQGITWGIQQIQQAFNWLKGGWDWFWGGPSSWFGWAKGTNDAPRGIALVGEQGPELVKFNGGEQVLNTRNTQRLLSDAGNGKSGNTFNVTFNNMQDTSAFAMVQQLKQYNRQMAINGVL